MARWFLEWDEYCFDGADIGGFGRAFFASVGASLDDGAVLIALQLWWVEFVRLFVY